MLFPKGQINMLNQPYAGMAERAAVQGVEEHRVGVKILGQRLSKRVGKTTCVFLGGKVDFTPQKVALQSKCGYYRTQRDTYRLCPYEPNQVKKAVKCPF